MHLVLHLPDEVESPAGRAEHGLRPRAPQRTPLLLPPGARRPRPEPCEHRNPVGRVRQETEAAVANGDADDGAVGADADGVQEDHDEERLEEEEAQLER